VDAFYLLPLEPESVTAHEGPMTNTIWIRLALERDSENAGVDCWNEMPTMQGRVPEWIYGL
jgi:hypothetical protein